MALYIKKNRTISIALFFLTLFLFSYCREEIPHVAEGSLADDDDDDNNNNIDGFDDDDDGICIRKCDEAGDCAVDEWCDTNRNCCFACDVGQGNEEHCGAPGEICVNCVAEGLGECSENGKCTCTDHNQCGPGQYCVDGECIFCDQDGYCGPDCVDCAALSDNHHCIDGQCVQCREDEDCKKEGYYCEKSIFTCVKPVETFDFENNECGFTATPENSLWTWDAVGEDGPNNDEGHGKVWKLKVPGDFYQCRDETLTSPTFDLAQYSGKRVWITWDTWFKYCSIVFDKRADYDGGHLIEFNNGDGWSQELEMVGWNVNSIKVDKTCQEQLETIGKPGLTGISKYWTQKVATVQPDTLTDNFQLRFVHVSGSYNFPEGKRAYLVIDDIKILIGE